MGRSAHAIKGTNVSIRGHGRGRVNSHRDGRDKSVTGFFTSTNERGVKSRTSASGSVYLVAASAPISSSPKSSNSFTVLREADSDPLAPCLSHRGGDDEVPSVSRK